MNNHHILLAGMMLASTVVKAQEAVMSLGGSYVNNSAIIDYTIGETLIATFSSETTELTQGLHQTKLMIADIVSGVEKADITMQVSVFPNPTSDQFTIAINKETTASLEIIDMHARVVYKEAIKDTQSVIDITALKSGIYMLNLRSENKELIKSFRILKVN